MNKPVHISSNNKISYDIEVYNRPEFVYIPLENRTGANYKQVVNEGEYVFKGQVVAVNEKIDFPIHSSVSGYVNRIDEKIINNGKKVKCIVIENDFKEKYEKSRVLKKNISTYTKDKFISDLKNNGITGLGGSDFPTFLKYDNDNIKYLLVNAVECEPFIASDKAVCYCYADSILEGIDNILEVMNIPKAIIVIKDVNTEIINSFNKYIGTYPNIKIHLTKDAYPNGWERYLVKNVLGIEYDNYPVEKGIIVSNVSTIYAIYEMIKYSRPLTERVITVTGPGIKNKKNIKVKVGTLASEIISSLDGYKNIKKPLFIAGGPMMGNSISSDDLVITKDLNCILIIEDHFEKNLPCIKCGKCAEVCPAGIFPVLIMENNDNIKNLEKLDTNKCVECGLCSYICPSKIEVREFVRIAKEKVNNK